VANVIDNKAWKEQSSLHHHLLKQQLPNISCFLSRDVQSNATSTIEDLSMLSVIQRTQNSPLPDKIMMETRGWREENGLVW